MATQTYVPIATQTISGSSVSSLTFSSIPGTYTDLKLTFTGVLGNSNIINLTVNGSSSAIYSKYMLYGAGSGTGSSSSAVSSTFLQFANGTMTGTYPASYELNFLWYANTSLGKTLLVQSSENNASTGQTVLTMGLINTSSAITSITLSASTINVGCTATLWGI